MLNHLLLGMTVVVPVFLLMGLGFFLRYKGYVSAKAFSELNEIVFLVLLPSNVFYSISRNEVKDVMNFNLVLFVAVGFILSFLLALFLIPKWVKQDEQRGVVIQAVVRGNFIIMGFPILSNLFGPDIISLCAVILLASMPLYNITSIMTLEHYKMAGERTGSLLFSVLKNPLIIATLLGILFIFIPMPAMIEKTVKMMADASGTIALIALGGSLSLTGFKGNQRILRLVSCLRLILFPALFIHAAYLLGFSEKEIFVIAMFFASPTAVTTYAITKKIGGDSALSGQIILYATLLSLFSYVFWIAYIKSFLV